MKILRQEIATVLMIKVIALGLIWWLFFSSPPRLNDAYHLITPATSAPSPDSSKHSHIFQTIHAK